ncbi:hypothetical protein DOTSEDRAFT_92149 [Dothistroma septosporum NZE10]|uniref:G protein-coupled receptor GPR1/2/3 C-terminal domain-containing protein n=2 Tax=Dothistroma septosporum TaxID=64363 RepID=M2YIZ1_DOTSN|nr:hypothetical protein [Dothistroma septosporum]EME38856.1 hypothetical protein DOTSEDRAFT_92149 [Dothistroma septosporum NZE10]
MSATFERSTRFSDFYVYLRSIYSVEHELEQGLRKGLLPVGLLAALSVYSCLVLLIFIVHRFHTEWKRYGTSLGQNQYVVLVFNLLLADLMQSIGFLITWHWYLENDIVSPSVACFVQGWMIHSGDLSSGFFVLAIAVYTYFTAVHGGRLGQRLFVTIVSAVWTLAFALTIIGTFSCYNSLSEDAVWPMILEIRTSLTPPSDHRSMVLGGREIRPRATVAPLLLVSYKILSMTSSHTNATSARIFLIQSGTITLYFLTFILLRRRSRRYFPKGLARTTNASAITVKKVNRIAIIMMLYPCCYVLLTLPLSVGRMWSMAHGRQTGIIFSCIAGSLMTSCGWVDCLLYSLTRRRLLQDTMSQGSGARLIERQGPPGRSDSVLVTRSMEFREEPNAPPDPQLMASAHQRDSSHDRQSMCATVLAYARHGSADTILGHQATKGRINASISTDQQRQSSSDEASDDGYALHTWEKTFETSSRDPLANE